LRVVEIKNLTIEYPGVKAVDNVSFSIEQNDFLGIIGPNGAGKSTLFSCMLGLNNQYSGAISFFGKNIRESKKYLKDIGYVPQKPIFEKNFPATVREVLRMGLRKIGLIFQLHLVRLFPKNHSVQLKNLRHQLLSLLGIQLLNFLSLQFSIT